MKKSIFPAIYKPTAIDQLFTETFAPITKLIGDTVSNSESVFSVDVIENDNSFELKAELPGVKKEDISVDVNDGLLRIKAERKQKTVEKDSKYIKTESSYGLMERSFEIGSIDPESIQASYIDGVLSIILQKQTPNLKTISID